MSQGFPTPFNYNKIQAVPGPKGDPGGIGPEGPGQGVDCTTKGCVGDGTTDCTAGFALAATAASSDPSRTVYVPAGSYKLASTQTISAPLKFAPGAMLKPASGQTVTLSQPPIANSQIFDTSSGGKVIVKGCELSAAWWGARGDGVTDDTAAIQAALDSCADYNPGVLLGNRINLSPGKYPISKPLLLQKNGIKIAGSGVGQTALVRTPSATWSGPLLILSPDYAPNWTLAPSLVTGAGNSLVYDPGADTDHQPLINLRDNPAMSLDGMSQITIEFFFNPDVGAAGVGGNILTSLGQVRNQIEVKKAFQLSLDATALYLQSFLTTSGSGAVVIGVNHTITSGLTHHIALTYDGSHVRWFDNGVLIDTQAATGTIIQEFYEMIMLGWSSLNFPDGADEVIVPCKGKIDSIRVSQVCRYTSGFTPPTSKHSLDTDTMMLVNFDGLYHMCLIGQCSGSVASMGTPTVDIYMPIRPNPFLIGAAALTECDIGHLTLEGAGVCSPLFMASAPGCYFHDMYLDQVPKGIDVHFNCFESNFTNIQMLLNGHSVSGSNKTKAPYAFSFVVSGICAIRDCLVLGGSSLIASSESSLTFANLTWVSNECAQICCIVGVLSSLAGTGLFIDNETLSTLWETVLLNNQSSGIQLMGGNLDVGSSTGVPILEIVSDSSDPSVSRSVFIGVRLAPSASSSICKFRGPQSSPVDFFNCPQIGANTNTPYGDSNGNPRVEGYTYRKITSGTSSIANDWDQTVALKVAGVYNLTTPAHPTVGQPFIVKDQQGDAGTNTKTITANAGQTIDGSPSATITVNFGRLSLSFDGISDWMS